MTYKISLPGISGNGSVKDMIMNALSTEWPLTAREIFNKVKAGGKSTTYQAVHKSIGELVKEGVLAKEAKAYSISQEYIKSLKEFGARLESLYEKKGKDILADLEKKGYVHLEFDKQIEMGKFLIDMIADTCEKDEKIFLLFRYVWCPLTFSEREYTQMKKICSRAHPILLTSASESMPIEKKFGELWSAIGMDVRFDVDVTPVFETVIYKDLVIEVLFPYEMEITRLEERKKSLEEINFDWYYDRILRNTRTIYMCIRKNKTLAEECKQHAKYLAELSGKGI
jgi:predicted transcriptional regulator